MTELAKLIERVEAATGPDRALDAALFQQIDPECPPGAIHMADPSHDPGDFTIGHYGAYTFAQAPIYTLSIDSAIDLVDRVLPEATWELSSKGPNGKFAFYILIGGRFLIEGDVERYGYGPTAPLAILAALLRALSARSP